MFCRRFAFDLKLACLRNVQRTAHDDIDPDGAGGVGLRHLLESGLQLFLPHVISEEEASVMVSQPPVVCHRRHVMYLTCFLHHSITDRQSEADMLVQEEVWTTDQHGTSHSMPDCHSCHDMSLSPISSLRYNCSSCTCVLYAWCTAVHFWVTDVHQLGQTPLMPSYEALSYLHFRVKLEYAAAMMHNSQACICQYTS